MRLAIRSVHRELFPGGAAIVVCLVCHFQAVADEPVKKAPITEAEVNAAQQAWCDGLVKIGKALQGWGRLQGRGDSAHR